MTRKIVQTGSSLAVRLPKEVVEQFKLKKGNSVDELVETTLAVAESKMAVEALAIWFRQRLRSGE